MSSGEEDPKAPHAVPSPSPTKLLGECIRRLREAAGLTRSHLARECQIRDDDLKGSELGRRPLPDWALRRLLTHPSMRELPARAAAVGVNLAQSDGGAPPEKE